MCLMAMSACSRLKDRVVSHFLDFPLPGAVPGTQEVLDQYLPGAKGLAGC